MKWDKIHVPLAKKCNGDRILLEDNSTDMAAYKEGNRFVFVCTVVQGHIPCQGWLYGLAVVVMEAWSCAGATRYRSSGGWSREVGWHLATKTLFGQSAMERDVLV